MSFELKEQPAEQLAEFEKRINDIPLVIDPCKMCCWFYDSKFEVKV